MTTLQNITNKPNNSNLDNYGGKGSGKSLIIIEKQAFSIVICFHNGSKKFSYSILDT